MPVIAQMEAHPSLGPNHPDTLTGRHLVAQILNWLGRDNEALPITQEVAGAMEAHSCPPMTEEAGGFRLAPGAHACLALDIMNEVEGLVGAETFAAVTPGNNGKLDADLCKLAARPEKYRYMFFMSPGYPRHLRPGPPNRLR
jgi:hypothetical protein